MTKLQVPRKPRRGLVVRPRLLERLERGTEARLTLVSAPAGFGKTTLVAAWLSEMPSVDRSVAWVSLDPADNEPTLFWTYLVTALHGAASVGPGALELITSAVPINSALPALLNELAAAPGQVWLVLDDYHLIEHHEIRDDLAFFLEHLPSQVHVVLLTRADPGLPLSRWRVRGELVEIRADDLRFSSDEAGAYLDAVAEVALDADDVARLGERTEGWIAALQLAALSLRGREDVSGFIARFAGDDRYVVDYLVDEVLQHQPAATREFLLQSSILDRLTGALCDAVTGDDDGSSMLVTLERANLFTVALDDRREWYRYHHLFRDMLRARLLADHPDRVLLLHRRASRWYATHELTDEAIDHALAGHDFPRAGDLMERAMPTVRRNRQDARMHSWLKALPDETVRRSPVLSVFYGNMLMASGDPDAAELRFADVERTLAASADDQAPPWADTEELHTLPATIAIYRASLAHVRGDAHGTAEHARRALELAGPRHHLARGGAAGFLGLVAWARGDVTTALESLTEAVASLAAAGTRVDELTTTVALADLWLVAGRPSKARQLLERALQRAQVWGASVSGAAAELEVGLAELDLEVGDLGSATLHLDAAAPPGNRSTTTTERSCRWFVARGLLALATGEASEGADLLHQAEKLYRPGFFPDVRPVPALRARVWITQGRLSEAASWARERGVTPADDVTYLSEFEHLTLVRLLLAQHRDSPSAGAADQAVQLLERLHEAAQTAGRAGSLLEIGMLQALAQEATADRLQAIETLTTALAAAPEPDGHVRLFLNEGAPMRSLLTDLDRRGHADPHLVRLSKLSTADEAGAACTGQRLLPVPADALSGRELEVLRLLDSALTVPEIARNLFVSSNTVRTHTKHIFTKLDVTSRRAAVDQGRERGLI